MINFADETLVEIAHLFSEEKKDKNRFVFNRTLHQNWTGLWRIESQKEKTGYDPVYLHFYEHANELKGTVLTKDRRPIEAQVTRLTKDSIGLIVPFPSHTRTLQLGLAEGKLSGKSHCNKPLPYLLKKRLTREVAMDSMLKARILKNGTKLH